MVNKKTLLIIAGIVWILAGFNVARLGIISYKSVEIRWYYYLFSTIIFVLFGTMFYKMTVKHTSRILGYEDRKQFWYFFDKKSYLIMVVMMGGGIWLRNSGLAPDNFIAFFYTGLGLALFLAGVVFNVNYFKIK